MNYYWSNQDFRALEIIKDKILSEVSIHKEVEEIMVIPTIVFDLGNQKTYKILVKLLIETMGRYREVKISWNALQSLAENEEVWEVSHTLNYLPDVFEDVDSTKKVIYVKH